MGHLGPARSLDALRYDPHQPRLLGGDAPVLQGRRDRGRARHRSPAPGRPPVSQYTAVHGGKVSLLRVLGPAHVWALGVGIVLVGEYMGWNFAVGKGGALAALIACWGAGLLYTCVAMIDSEVTSTVAAAGGQYAQAK